MTSPPVSELIERMGALRHFAGLSPDELQQIIAAGSIRRYPENVTLFREEEPCAGVFVLVSGQVYLRKTGPDGRENILVILDAVTMFNEVSVLDGGPNSATAVTATDCIIWRASGTHFSDLLDRFPQLPRGLLPILAARNRWLISQYEDLSFRTVRARTAKLLLELSNNGQAPIERRRHTTQELAARLATVPEAISRSLSEFSRKGTIESSRSTIIVLQPDELKRMALLSPDFPL